MAFVWHHPGMGRRAPDKTPNRQESIPIHDWRKQAFLEWLCTAPADREPSTMEELAAQLNVSRRAMSNWKVDPEFLAEWEKLYRRTVGSPERAQRVLDTLYRTATDPDDPKHVQAADKYLQAIDAVKPQRINVEVSGSARDLSDEQLNALLAEAASIEKAHRQLSDGTD